jgi:NodT family efflux transporter outer membrane factor (OMF) lipoprotein
MADAGAPAPGSWSATREARTGVDADWLRKTGGAPLSALVAEALKANPDLKASAARVERAAAEARIAGAGRLPSLGLSGQATRQKQTFIGFPSQGPGVTGALTDVFGVSLDAAWEIDVWGRLRAGQEAAIADAEGSQLEFQAARVSLAAQVAKAWLALAEANEQVALATAALEARSQLATAVRERFERAINEDGGSAAQVRLTEAEVAVGEATLAQRKQEKDRAIRQLELLLARYPSGKSLAGATLPPLPPPPPAGLPSELLLRRPDIRAAERELAASGRRTLAASLARFPSIRLTGSFGTITDSLAQVINSDRGVWSIGGSLTQPLFEGGRITAEIDRTTATEKENAAKLQRVVLNAFGEVEQALAAETYLREREQAAARASTISAEAARRSDEEFSAGTGDVLTLINAREQEINTASQLAAIRRLRLDNRIDLHLALGGDFSL